MEGKKRSRLPLLLTSVASLLLGFLGSPVFDYFAGKVLSPDRVLIVLLPVLGLIIVILCAFTIGWSEESSHRLYESTSREISKLADSTGPKVRMLSYSSDENNRESFQRIIDLINNAKQEIQVLDNAPWSANFDPTQVAHGLKDYYKALNNYVDSSKSYVRIIQHPDAQIDTFKAEDIKNPYALAHFKKVLDKSNNLNAHCCLMGSVIFFPKVSFILIDHRYLIWEVPFRDLKGELQFSNDIFIDDPDGKMFTELIQAYNFIVQQATTVKEFL